MSENDSSSSDEMEQEVPEERVETKQEQGGRSCRIVIPGEQIE